MGRRRGSAERGDTLEAFELEADAFGARRSLISRLVGARDITDAPILHHSRASPRRNWLVYGFGALALIQAPFVLMWALQSRTAPSPATVAPIVSDIKAIDGAVATTSTPGSIEVVTDPANVPISLDGQVRGTSPLSVSDLAAGTYAVAARFPNGTVEREIRVEPGTAASLVITMPRPAGPASGWIAVDSPASLQILQDGRLIGTTDVAQLMLPAGQHSLEFASEELGFRTQQTVTVNAGATSTVRLELPQAPVSINAQPWAEVWIDGERLGETPIGNAYRTIGRHEVRLRHPTLGERTTSVLVTLREPVRIAVDLRADN